MTRRPSHPGALLSDILPDAGITAADLANQLSIPSEQLDAILKGKAPVTLEIAEKLGSIFKDGPDIWIRMQTAHDMWQKLDAASQAETDYFEYPIVYEPYCEQVSYRCPCCRCLTLHERAGYEICPICFWEDDGQDDPYADQVRDGPNGDLSLTQARRNYAVYGAMEERFVKSVRPPTDDETSPLVTKGD